jgi:uncharacterized membrane protein YdjX (TVP38/TMEM64 family)
MGLMMRQLANADLGIAVGAVLMSLSIIMKRLITVALYGFVIAIGYMYKEALMGAIQDGGSFVMWSSMFFIAILVFFPIMPFALAAGFIGAGLGTVICLIGSLVGTMLMFWMARYGFRDFTCKMMKKFPAVKPYEAAFEKNAFLSIVFVRAVPLLPAPVVNVLCGNSFVRPITFLLATFIGKLPSFLLFTFVGQQFLLSKSTAVSIYLLYVIVIAMLTTIAMKKVNRGVDY